MFLSFGVSQYANRTSGAAGATDVTCGPMQCQRAAGGGAAGHVPLFRSAAPRPVIPG